VIVTFTSEEEVSGMWGNSSDPVHACDNTSGSHIGLLVTSAVSVSGDNLNLTSVSLIEFPSSDSINEDS
jgi:hypothetical protein